MDQRIYDQGTPCVQHDTQHIAASGEDPFHSNGSAAVDSSTELAGLTMARLWLMLVMGLLKTQE